MIDLDYFCGGGDSASGYDSDDSMSGFDGGDSESGYNSNDSISGYDSGDCAGGYVRMSGIQFIGI